MRMSLVVVLALGACQESGVLDKASGLSLDPHLDTAEPADTDELPGWPDRPGEPVGGRPYPRPVDTGPDGSDTYNDGYEPPDTDASDDTDPADTDPSDDTDPADTDPTSDTDPSDDTDPTSDTDPSDDTDPTSDTDPSDDTDPADTEPPDPCPVAWDFERDANGGAVRAGQRMEDAFAASGVRVAGWYDRARTKPAWVIAFDSAHPTGGDPDLGTPNQRYGGPGVGTGGATNDRALGMLLILAENTRDWNRDGRVDDPDDNATGGVIRFLLDRPACVDGLDLIDVDSDEHASVVLLDDQGAEVAREEVPGVGDNGFFHANVHGCGVSVVQVSLMSSGGVAGLRACLTP